MIKDSKINEVVQGIRSLYVAKYNDDFKVGINIQEIRDAVELIQALQKQSQILHDDMVTINNHINKIKAQEDINVSIIAKDFPQETTGLPHIIEVLSSHIYTDIRAIKHLTDDYV